MLAALAGVLGRGAAAGAASGGGELVSMAAQLKRSKEQTDAYAKSLGLTTSQMNRAQAAINDARGKESAAIAGQVGKVQQSAGALSVITSKIEAFGSTLTGALTAGIVGLQAIADPIAQLSGLAAPAALEAFTRAVNDDFAVVGRALLPITEAMTRSFERLGEFLAGAEPIINKAANSLAAIIDKLGAQWLDTAQDLGPALEFMAEFLIGVVTAVADVTSALMSLSKWLGDVRNQTLALIGIKGGAYNKEASAKGAAVRDVHVVTSAESVSNEAQAKALQQALNPGKAEQKEPVEVQEGILTWITTNIPTKKDVEQLFNNLISHLPDLPSLPGSQTISDAGDALSPLFSLIKSQMTR